MLEILCPKWFQVFLCFVLRDPEFVFYDQLKQTMNAYR